MRISDWSSDVCSSDLPQRFEEGVGEAEIQQVLHSLLAQVMVDAEDRRLVEDLVERGVERLRGGQVAAEGLFHHHPRAAGAAAGVERADHGRETEHGRASGGDRECTYE